MSRLQIHPNGKNFLLEGKPFFYLGDTIWSAFTNITLEEWEYYLSIRKKQGFNVLQINTMPQWDRCMSDVGTYPFRTEDGCHFDFNEWDDSYYERARTMCRMAREQGFWLALVVLWLNYVPGTWGSRILDINVMPAALVRKYTRRIVKEFDEFEPIYVVSGDTDFDTPEAISYYQTALDVLCEESPETLKTMHIKRGYDVIPEVFLNKMDFYMFQSGHNSKEQHMAYYLPENFIKKYPGKPMLNAEPCYEQMGYSRQEYGRFEAMDIRKAAWSSILSGACAGVTYGAHGVWNWQKVNKPKNRVLGEGFDEALPWQDAIKFPGAWDYGMIRNILEEHNCQELQPANEYLENDAKEIRMAISNDRYFIYIPYNTAVTINMKLDGYQARAIDLTTKRIAYIETRIEGSRTLIGMHPFQNDVLLIVEAPAFQAESRQIKVVDIASFTVVAPGS